MSVTGSLASTVGAKNPIRYRGYYYDTETELYYLNSRYYDPETGRFISPDVVAEGGNLYTYCTNDPVNRSDDSGYLSKAWKRRLMKIAAGIVFTVGAVAVTVATGGAALPVIAGIVGGAALSGAIGGTIALIQGNDGKEAIIDGLVDGFMWSGFFSAGSATFNAVRSAGTFSSTSSGTTSTNPAEYTSGSPQSIGKTGERLSGIIKNTRTITAPSGRVRIPDGLSLTKLQEVKNVARLSKTRQLTDFMAYSAQNGLQMELFVRPTTVMSKPLMAALDKYKVIIRYLWLQ